MKTGDDHLSFSHLQRTARLMYRRDTQYSTVRSLSRWMQPCVSVASAHRRRSHPHLHPRPRLQPPDPSTCRM